MNRQLLAKLLGIIGLLGATSFASANVPDEANVVDRMVVTANPIQIQMYQAQARIRSELIAGIDWREVALNSLRGTLSQPVTVAQKTALAKQLASN